MSDKLGDGAHSSVYRATDTNGNACAIKCLGVLDTDALRAFEREASALSRVRDRHLVKLLDHGVDGERGAWLAMELVQGTSLRVLLEDGPMMPAIAIAIVAELAQGVEALAAQGIVHRDIKPENVLLATDGRVMLVDLGSALLASETITTNGRVTGTPAYMAPEQLEGAVVSSSADVWALGVVLYELITGKRPFFRERLSEETAAILAGAFEPIDTSDAHAARALALWFAQCFDRDSAARPSARVLSGTLLNYLDESDVQLDDLQTDLAAWRKDRKAFESVISARIADNAIERAKGFMTAAPVVALRWISHAAAHGADASETNALTRKAEASLARLAHRGPRRTVMLRVLAAAFVIAIAASFSVYLRTESTPLSAPSPVPRRRFLHDSEIPQSHLARLPNDLSRRLDRARAQVQRHPTARNLFARAKLFLEGRMDRYAHRDLRKALELDPAYTPALREIAFLYDRFGHAELALALLRDVTTLAPNNADAWADVAYIEPDANKALQDAERALSIAPRHARASRLLCSLRVHANASDALSACDAAVRNAPRDPYPLGDRAEAKRKAGNLRGALQDLNVAVAMRPEETGFRERRDALRDRIESESDSARTIQTP